MRCLRERLLSARKPPHDVVVASPAGASAAPPPGPATEDAAGMAGAAAAGPAPLAVPGAAAAGRSAAAGSAPPPTPFPAGPIDDKTRAGKLTSPTEEGEGQRCGGQCGPACQRGNGSTRSIACILSSPTGALILRPSSRVEGAIVSGAATGTATAEQAARCAWHACAARLLASLLACSAAWLHASFHSDCIQCVVGVPQAARHP